VWPVEENTGHGVLLLTNTCQGGKEKKEQLLW
jgi:hypothetical protein